MDLTNTGARPRLCLIYFQDVISLLPRENIDALVLISHYVESTIANFPRLQLPRRKFQTLALLRKEEFIAYLNTIHYHTGLHGASLIFGDCCRDLLVIRNGARNPTIKHLSSSHSRSTPRA